jgi:RimJ/RimL family protein N-acetyltransferase
MSVIPLPTSSTQRGPGLTVPIRGGHAVLRPLLPGEHAPLEAVFQGLSHASREARYLVPVQALTRTMREVLAAVDGRCHIAWLASVDEQPVGIARVVTVAPGTAEIAYEVVDAHHGRGLGTLLVDAVTTAASVAGVRRLQATVHPSNHASLRLLERLGLHLRPQDGLLEGEGGLRLLDPPRLDRQSVVRVALATPCPSTGPDNLGTRDSAAAH